MAIGENFSHICVTFTAFVGTPGVDRRVILRELEFDADHDCGSVGNIVLGMERCGWTIHEVVIYTDNDHEFPHIKESATFAAVFEAMTEEPDDAGKLIAYGELFGWTESNFQRNRWGRKCEEGFYGVYDTLVDFAKDFVENDEEFAGILDSSYVSIDWERTAHNLLNDFATHEYGYEVYVFANH